MQTPKQIVLSIIYFLHPCNCSFRLPPCTFASLHIFMFFYTAMVPVHVVMNPPMAVATEQELIAEFNKANVIVDQLIQTSPDVIGLTERLRQNITTYEITLYQDDLRKKFEAALLQGGISQGMARAFSLMRAYNTDRVIQIVLAELGDSIVVYFLCKTIKALYKLGQMIVSGFMHAVFAVAIESLARTTVDVYVRADEFNLKLLCLSTPQDRGTSIDRLQLLIVNNR